MASTAIKVTFTLDDVTVARLKRTAARLGRPQSQVVRDAVRDYADRVGRLSEQERLRALEVLDAIRARPSSRPAAGVDVELRAIRKGRRTGGRRHPTP